MFNHKSITAFATLWGLLISAAACSDPWVTVHLDGAWPERLHVSVTYEDGVHEEGTPFDVTPKNGLFSFFVPRANGTVRLVVTTTDSTTGKLCRTQILASEQLSVEGSRYGKEITLSADNLKPLVPPRCDCDGGWCQAMPASNIAWNAIWGTDPNNVWLAGSASDLNANILQWNSGWKNGTSFSTSNVGIWGRPSEVWVAADDFKVYKANPIDRFPYQSYQFNFRGVWGLETGNIWVVGGKAGKGIIIEKDNNGFKMDGGSSWSVDDGTAKQPSSCRLNGIWGSSYDHIWAVGCNGVILAWSAASYHDMKPEAFPSNSGTMASLNAVWGSASNNVFAVGDAATILQWDGSVWAPMKLPENTNAVALNSIHGSSGTDIWAVGDTGLLLHYNGIEWRLQRAPTRYNLRGVRVFDRDNVWLVGENGTILLRDP